MSILNMVESNEQKIQDVGRLVKTKSIQLSIDKLINSILMMEYSWEFFSLVREKDKIAWALSHAELRIVQWNERRGRQEEVYEDWKKALIERFYKRIPRRMEFVSIKQLKDQKLSEFLIDMNVKGKFLGFSEKDALAIAVINIREEEDRRKVQMLLEGELEFTEKLLEKIEDLELMDELKNSTVQKKVIKEERASKSCNLSLKYSGEDKPLLAVNIRGRRVLALCDTGSDINIIDESISGGMQISPTNIKALAANQGSINVLGKVQLPLMIDGKSVITEFIVCRNINKECILGLPFLKQHKTVISFNSEEIQIGAVDKSGKLLGKLVEYKDKPVKGVECCIETTYGKRITVKPYMIPQALEDKVLKEIENLKDKGYIVESRSSWCNNLVPVEKPDGSIRITINFKLLNQLVEQDKYSLPRMDEIIHSLRDQKIFSKIDLKDGFFHIPVRMEDRHKTAFRVKNKLYEWNVMPQGFVNSPAIFQRFMDQTLENLIGKYCYVYVDDILIFGRNEKEHKVAFETVLNRLVEAGLTGNEKKIEYNVRKVKFLGHIIEHNKIRLSLDKKEALEGMKAPTNKEEVQQFMGIVNYYRKFIDRCADKSEELLKFLRKDVKFVWGETEQAAFELLKKELLEPHVLRQPDFNKRFILDTDASNIGLGAVLTQEFEDGEHPVMYLSRRLKNEELNYSITELEMLSAMWAMEQLHYFLYGRKFTLRTDHKALLAFNSKGDVQTRRIERWYYRLENYTFDVVYRKGEEQGNADALSRCHMTEMVIDEELTEEKKRGIIAKVHKDLVHRGTEATFDKINEMYGDIIGKELVKNELKQCVKCKEFSPRNYPGVKFNEAFEVGEKVAIDIMGPIEGHYVIAGIDYFSRKGFAMALKTKSAKGVIGFLRKINSVIKVNTLICDNAREFNGNLMKEWCDDNRVKIHFTTPYHHQANGKVERFIRTIREGLAKCEKKGPLKVKLKYVIDTYNTIKHTGTSLTPNEALDPSSWSELKRKQFQERIAKYREYARIKDHPSYEVGQEVLVQEDISVDKQKPKYNIGGKVVKVLGNDTYEVIYNKKSQKRYASQLRPMPILNAGML